MATVQIKGLDQARAALQKLADWQMSEAVADGLNRTSLRIERREKVAMAKELDRPTPFTLNSIRRWKATPTRLRAGIFVMRIQERYLQTTVAGGTVRNDLTPVLKNVYLDNYGNLLGKKQDLEAIARALKTREVSRRYGRRRRGKGRQTGLPADMFIGNVRGTLGLWQRVGRGRLNLLVRVQRKTDRRKRFNFFGVAEQVAQQYLVRDVRDAIDARLQRLR